MKTFEGKATWTASEWGEETPDCVVVSGLGISWHIPHEDRIERVILTAPDDLKRYVRGEVLRCRPLKDDELVLRGKVRKMRMASPGEDYSSETVSAPEPGDPAVIIDHGGEGSAPYTREELEALARGNDSPRGWPRALAYLDKHAPKLADNEVQFPGGPRELRWHEGRPEIRLLPNGVWVKRHLGIAGSYQKKADAWFRANCPIDRFVTDDGEVLEFRMRDDGEAEVVGREGSETISSYRSALYRFRDAERGRKDEDGMTKAELEQEVKRLRDELARKDAAPVTAETLRGMVTEWETERDRKIPELVAKICAQCAEAARVGRTFAVIPRDISPFPGLVSALESRGLRLKTSYCFDLVVSWEEPGLTAKTVPAPGRWWQFWRWFS